MNSWRNYWGSSSESSSSEQNNSLMSRLSAYMGWKSGDYNKYVLDLFFDTDEERYNFANSVNEIEKTRIIPGDIKVKLLLTPGKPLIMVIKKDGNVITIDDADKISGAKVGQLQQLFKNFDKPALELLPEEVVEDVKKRLRPATEEARKREIRSGLSLSPQEIDEYQHIKMALFKKENEPLTLQFSNNEHTKTITDPLEIVSVRVGEIKKEFLEK